jgi:glycosyltransferase involved in cell wall biosynthesis
MSGTWFSENDSIKAVCVCKNREQNLLQSLPTWLKVDGLDEINIYDFCSDKPVYQSLSENRLLHPKVKVFQSYKEDGFSLSKFLNVALSITSADYILKLDTDYKIDRSFIKSHPIKSCFYTGDWRAAKDSNESNLTGLLFAKKKDMVRVNGYNENIKTWGYEDEDLYNRMSKVWGLKRRVINMDLAYHIPHTSEVRAIEGGIETYWSTVLWDDFGMYNLVRKNMDLSKKKPWRKNSVTTKGNAAPVVEGLYFFNYV